MATALRTQAPLRAALQEFGRLDGHTWPVSDEPARAHHLAAADLIRRDAALQGLLTGEAMLLSTDGPVERAVVLAGHWAWLLTLPARATWMLARVIPDVHPTNVSFVAGPRGLPEVALFATDRYACLAGSAATACDDALVFASPHTLNAWWLGRVLDAHLEPLMSTLQRATGAAHSDLQRAVAGGFAAARDAVAHTLQLCRPCGGT
jgi:hypothetical protein